MKKLFVVLIVFLFTFINVFAESEVVPVKYEYLTDELGLQSGVRIYYSDGTTKDELYTAANKFLLNATTSKIQDIVNVTDAIENILDGVKGEDVKTEYNVPDGVPQSDIPDVIQGDLPNVNGVYYLYIRVNNGYGRFILNQSLPSGGAFYVDDGDYFGNVYLAIPQQGGASFEWLTPEHFSISTGNYNGLDCWTIWMYNFGTGDKNDVSIWTNSVAVSGSLRDGESKYSQKNPTIDNSVGGGYITPSQDIIDKEVEDGHVSVTTTITKYFNVKIPDTVKVDVQNFEELCAMLKDQQLGGDGDPSRWFKFLEENSKWEDDDEVLSLNDFIDQSMILLGVMPKPKPVTYAALLIEDGIEVEVDEDEDDGLYSDVSILVYPITIIKQFFDAFDGVEIDGTMNFPEIKVGDDVYLTEQDFNFYQYIYDMGLADLHEMYYLVINTGLTLGLLYYAKRKFAEFQNGQKGDAS